MKKALAFASAFFNDVCLWQMMRASPNDAASLMMLASPDVIRQASHHCERNEQHHFERSEKHHSSLTKEP